jgi:hypothetical protein
MNHMTFHSLFLFSLFGARILTIAFIISHHSHSPPCLSFVVISPSQVSLSLWMMMMMLMLMMNDDE